MVHLIFRLIPALDTTCDMKRILIIFAVGLTASEQLDRKYLPPPGARFSGGNPGDLQVPFRFIKKSPQMSPVFDQEKGLLRYGYIDHSEGPGTNFVEHQKNVGDNFNLQTPHIEFPSTLPMTPLPQFATIVATRADYDTIRRPASNNLQVNNFQHTNDYVPKSSTQQQISRLAPDGSIDLNNIGNQHKNEFSKETPPRHYSENTKNMQDRTMNKNGNFEGHNFNETTLITDSKKQTSASFNAFVPSSPYKTLSLEEIRSKKDSISTEPRSERSQAQVDKNAVILNFQNIITPQGFSYSYDTSNEIRAHESGTANNGVRSKGAYSYRGDDGKIYKVVYTADENGFRPYGDHLPTPPPVPVAIQLLIENAAREKETDISDDGSYDEAKYGYKKYHGAMERYHPEMQGFSNTKRNQYGDYQKHILREGSVHKKHLTSSKYRRINFDMESNTGPLTSDYLKDESLVILPLNQAITPFRAVDKEKKFFQTGDVNNKPEKINSYSDEQHSYTFKQDESVDSKGKEDDNYLKSVESDKSSKKNKQNNIFNYHSQDILNLGNRDDDQKPYVNIDQYPNTKQKALVNSSFKKLAHFNKHVPKLIKSDNNNLRSVQANEQDNMGYFYVTPTTKFEETAYQNMNNETFPFDSDQELAIGDDDIVTISVPLNTASILNSGTPQTPATIDSRRYQEFDYLDSSKIPLYFVDSTTMPSNINMDHNETLEIELRPSITPGFGHNFSGEYIHYTNPQQSEASEFKDTTNHIAENEFRRPINYPKNLITSANMDVVSTFYGYNNRVDLYLKKSTKSKLKVENIINSADVNRQQDNSNQFQAVNSDGNTDYMLRTTPTVRIVGEDFSGPRRPQSFDPITGYQY